MSDADAAPANVPGPLDRRAFGLRTAVAVAAGLAPPALLAAPAPPAGTFEPPAGAPMWTPPANPDPSAILQEAARDARAGRHAVALAKHVWFHEHALEYQPSQYGVRLSFALSYWKNLADDYPPALEALKAARDKAAADLRAPAKDRPAGDRALFHAFNDFEALNRRLGEEKKTVALFRELDRTRPEVARETARLVRDTLVQQEDYALAGKYLDRDRFEIRLKSRAIELKLAAAPDARPEYREMIDRMFLKEVATHLAILARTDRRPEAAELAEQAKAVRSDAAFVKAVDEAVQGKFPPTDRR